MQVLGFRALCWVSCLVGLAASCPVHLSSIGTTKSQKIIKQAVFCPTTSSKSSLEHCCLLLSSTLTCRKTPFGTSTTHNSCQHLTVDSIPRPPVFQHFEPSSMYVIVSHRSQTPRKHRTVTCARDTLAPRVFSFARSQQTSKCGECQDNCARVPPRELHWKEAKGIALERCRSRHGPRSPKR